MINLKDEYKIIFLFKFQDKYLLELKELKSRTFFWIWIDQKKKSFQKLTFVAMKSMEFFEYREFEEGSLRFSDEAAEFRLGEEVFNSL